jgi:hypothetical protein
MWTQMPATNKSSIWYGGALSNNRDSIHQAWRAFVDTVPLIAGNESLVNP